MSKKYQKLVPVCIFVAAILAIIILFMMCKPKIDDYFNLRNEASDNAKKSQELESQMKIKEQEDQAKAIKLKSLKPIFKTAASDDSLGVFGDMFENVIRTAQSNGLLIRSIEYDMHPSNDILYVAASNNYNACELKFFFVGSYSQIRAFLDDMNKSFEYLTSISGINITAFPENENYLLINISITLYSEKPPSGTGAKGKIR